MRIGVLLIVYTTLLLYFVVNTWKCGHKFITKSEKGSKTSGCQNDPVMFLNNLPVYLQFSLTSSER